MASYRIFDIETVPDLSIWTPPDGKETTFPPPLAHRVVAISWVDLSGDDNEWYFYEGSRSLCSWNHDSPDVAEKALLAEFIAAQEKDRAILVSWNGRGFDLPVINMRALKHRLQMKFFYEDRDVRYRYSEVGHLDLMDWLADYGSSKNMKLGDAARLIGLPGKTGEVSGANVADQYAKGDDASLMQEVGKYCLSDSLQTALLFVRSRYHKGMISAEHHDKAVVLSFQDVCAKEAPGTFEGFDWDRLLIRIGGK